MELCPQSQVFKIKSTASYALILNFDHKQTKQSCQNRLYALLTIQTIVDT